MTPAEALDLMINGGTTMLTPGEERGIMPILEALFAAGWTAGAGAMRELAALECEDTRQSYFVEGSSINEVAVRACQNCANDVRALELPAPVPPAAPGGGQ